MDRGDLTEEHTFLFEKRNTFFQHLEAIFQENSFFDVTLYCNGECIRAHRVVLACCSPFIRKILKNVSSNEPVLVFSDISKNEMMYLIDYMYKGSVRVPNNFISSFEGLLKKFVDEGSHDNDSDSMEKAEADVTPPLSLDLATIGPNPVSHEEQTNSKTVMPGTSKEAAMSDCGSVKQQDQHKVINPYACKTKSGKEHDRSSCSPKKKTKSTTSRQMFEDSDVEVIEKDNTLLVITDAYDSSSPDFCRETRKPLKEEVLKDVELTSDDSDLVHPSSKKFKSIPKINNSADENEPAVAIVEERGWFMKQGGCTKKLGGKATEVTDFDQNTLSEKRNFCVVCKAFKKNIVWHIKKYHNFPIRKKFVCQVCFKKFAFKKFLEVHVCKK